MPRIELNARLAFLSANIAINHPATTKASCVVGGSSRGVQLESPERTMIYMKNRFPFLATQINRIATACIASVPVTAPNVVWRGPLATAHAFRHRIGTETEGRKRAST